MYNNNVTGIMDDNRKGTLSALTMSGQDCQLYATRRNLKFTFWKVEINLGGFFFLSCQRFD